MKKRINLKNNKLGKGFTLVELLIYIAILGLVIVGIIYFVISITNSRSKNYVVEEVHENARTAMDTIAQTIRSANGINTGQSIFESDPGELSLATTDAQKNPTIINLDQDDGVLLIKEGAASEVAITSDNIKITRLVFYNITGNSSRENIYIELEVSYSDGDQIVYNYTTNLKTSASVRE